MSVPDWWEALLLGVAAWRTFQLIGEDDILDTPRRYVTDRLSEYWQDFLTCPFCAGWWIALAWWGAWQLWGDSTLIAATPFVLSAVVVGVHRLLSSD